MENVQFYQLMICNQEREIAQTPNEHHVNLFRQLSILESTYLTNVVLLYSQVTNKYDYIPFHFSKEMK